MADQFIAEIRLFAHGATPAGWMSCDGQLLQVASPDTAALHALIGNRYGGDGRTTFALPNLNGRIPGGAGEGKGLSARQLGQTIGVPASMATVEHFPQHRHQLCSIPVKANNTVAAQHTLGRGCLAGRTSEFKAYASETEHIEEMGAGAISSFTNPRMEKHENQQPHLALRFCIAFQGVYPPRPGD
ncbi:tail fiber protein [Desulfovibrio aminophilus]|nr:tail fiber protein [Desulfovibrio aminophilus]MCM0755718.1 tail fiber protein [Desulfovibrio aminophilus]